MLSCREVARLVSERLDRDLSWWERMQLSMHLWMCGMCSGFARDLQKLREIARQVDALETGAELPEELKQQLRQQLKEH